MLKKLIGNQAVKKFRDASLGIYCIHASGLPVATLNLLDPTILELHQMVRHFSGLKSKRLSGEFCAFQWIVRQHVHSYTGVKELRTHATIFQVVQNKL